MFVFMAPMTITLREGKRGITARITDTEGGPLFDSDMDEQVIEMMHAHNMREPVGSIEMLQSKVAIRVENKSGLLTITYAKV